jgi:hypothetical protein
MQTVNFKRAEIALEHVHGIDFEHFFQAFYPALAGIDFLPLGGHQDGGADAIQGETVFEGSRTRAATFYQASVTEDHRAKIRHTVRRLREVGHGLVSACTLKIAAIRRPLHDKNLPPLAKVATFGCSRTK